MPEDFVILFLHTHPLIGMFIEKIGKGFCADMQFYGKGKQAKGHFGQARAWSHIP